MLPFFAAILCTIFTNAFGQSDFDPLGRTITNNMDKLIRVQLEWIEVKHEILTDLLAKDRRAQVEGLLSSNDQPLRDELTELIKKGDASVTETMMVIAQSGNRAKAESVMEFIYPTEYDPPRAGLAMQKDNQPEIAVTLPTPTAFEVRNVGATLEVDPTLGADDKTINVNLSPELVYRNENTPYGTYREGDNQVDIVMPNFYTAKVTTQLTVIDGETTLMGVLTPRDIKTGEADPSRKFMVFLKAEVLYVGLPIDKK